MQGDQWVDIIDHWSIIDHLAEMVDILEFVVDISFKCLRRSAQTVLVASVSMISTLSAVKYNGFFKCFKMKYNSKK